jgi:hypothetical protein
MHRNISKGHPPVTEPAVADHAAPDRPSRRALLGAGVIGAALAMAGSRPASAGTPGMSDEDAALIGFAIALELTARDLYDTAIDAGAEGQPWTAMRDHHRAYAQRLAGISGIPAAAGNAEVFDALESRFAGSDRADAAFELENVAAATHVELLGRIEHVQSANAIASIAATESRHATVLGLLSGRGDDLDALFLNTATALSPEA